MAETKWQQPAASGPPPQQQPASPRGLCFSFLREEKR